MLVSEIVQSLDKMREDDEVIQESETRLSLKRRLEQLDVPDERKRIGTVKLTTASFASDPICK